MVAIVIKELLKMIISKEDNSKIEHLDNNLLIIKCFKIKDF
jgi:hypothetical protein